jgi:alkaline phosphatase
VTATGFWWYRVAINNVGTHSVRLTVDSDVRHGSWTVAKPARRSAKNVILFIGDGLNIPITTATRLVSRGMTAGFPNEPLNIEVRGEGGIVFAGGGRQVAHTQRANV